MVILLTMLTQLIFKKPILTLFNSGPQNEKIKAGIEMDPLVEEMNFDKIR